MSLGWSALIVRSDLFLLLLLPSSPRSTDPSLPPADARSAPRRQHGPHVALYGDGRPAPVRRGAVLGRRGAPQVGRRRRRARLGHALLLADASLHVPRRSAREGVRRERLGQCVVPPLPPPGSPSRSRADARPSCNSRRPPPAVQRALRRQVPHPARPPPAPVRHPRGAHRLRPLARRERRARPARPLRDRAHLHHARVPAHARPRVGRPEPPRAYRAAAPARRPARRGRVPARGGERGRGGDAGGRAQARDRAPRGAAAAGGRDGAQGGEDGGPVRARGAELGVLDTAAQRVPRAVGRGAARGEDRGGRRRRGDLEGAEGA